MTVREQKEHAELSRLWVSREATLKEMLRCTELDRKRAAEHRGTKAIRVTEIARREWFRTLALTLAEYHKRHSRGRKCNISLGSIREMAEAAGAKFSRDDLAQFL